MDKERLKFADGEEREIWVSAVLAALHAPVRDGVYDRGLEATRDADLVLEAWRLRGGNFRPTGSSGGPTGD